MSELAAAVEALVEAFDGRAAAFASRLGPDADLRPDELVVGDADAEFPTGSAAKQLVLLAFAEAVVAGEIDPGERRTLDATYRDARPGSGVLRFLDADLAPTLRDAAALMMMVSDNVATDLVLDALGGPDAVNAAVAGIGVTHARITSPTVWAIPPAQFGMATPRGLASAWTPLTRDGPAADLCKAITWRHQHREGFARHVPFAPDLPDFGLPSPLRLWSKSGAYPTVSCEGGLFETDHSTWVLAVMADGVADWGNGSTAAGPTLRAQVSRLVFDAWG